jgi:hypothetical protein
MIDRYLSLPTVLVLLLLLTHHQLALQPGVCDVVKSVHVMFVYSVNVMFH